MTIINKFDTEPISAGYQEVIFKEIQFLQEVTGLDYDSAVRIVEDTYSVEVER